MADIFVPGSGDPSGLQIVDPVLSNVARQFAPHGFIYDQLTAAQPVNLKIGQYPVFDLESFFVNSELNNEVADDAATPILDIKWSTEFYHAKDFRLSVRLTNTELNQSNPALRLEVSKLKALLSQQRSLREKRLALALTNGKAGSQLELANTTLGGALWDAGTEETPATIQRDVQKAKKKVYEETGFTPNTLQITQPIAEAIAADPTIIKMIKYQVGVQLVEFGNVSLPSSLFGLKVVCADGVLQTTNGTLNEIWGKGPRVLYVNQAAGWGEPSVAYSFRAPVASSPTGSQSGTITQMEPAGTGDWAVVDRWVEPDPPAQRIRAWESVDEKIVAPTLGVQLANVIS